MCSVGAGLGGAGSVSVPVLEGESATLVCGTDLTGNPTPTITWTDNTGRLVNTLTLTFVSSHTIYECGLCYNVIMHTTLCTSCMCVHVSLSAIITLLPIVCVSVHCVCIITL